MSRICNLISKCIWPPVDWSESPRIRAVLPGKWQCIHPSPLPPRKRKFHIYTEHYQLRNFNNPFSLQPLENCEEAIHGEWKTNRHRGKIFRAFAGLKANMTQIKSEILLYKIKKAYFLTAPRWIGEEDLSWLANADLPQHNRGRPHGIKISIIISKSILF